MFRIPDIDDTTKHQFLGKIDFPLVTWDEVIFHLNKSIIENTEHRIFENFGFIIERTRSNKKVAEVGKEIQQKFFPTNKMSSYFFVSLLEKSETFDRHNDVVNVFFWQCIGITQWTVWDDKEYTYNLMPGELLYIPVGMDHQTKPITPRVGVSYGIELETQNV